MMHLLEENINKLVEPNENSSNFIEWTVTYLDSLYFEVGFIENINYILTRSIVINIMAAKQNHK